jgi:hypothetical protein
MRRQRPTQYPVLIEADGTTTPTNLSASPTDQPTDITLKTREYGWKPFRARFDQAQLAWIVSTIDWHPAAYRASR